MVESRPDDAVVCWGRFLLALIVGSGSEGRSVALAQDDVVAAVVCRVSCYQGMG